MTNITEKDSGNADANFQKVLKFFMDNILNININQELDDRIVIFLSQMKHYVINQRLGGQDDSLFLGERKREEQPTDNVFEEEINSLLEKIAKDDKSSNYTRHLFALKNLTSYMERDIAKTRKKQLDDNANEFYDKATLSHITKDCYDRYEGVNFYKCFTSYNHWQLKNMIKIEPDHGNICFVNKDRIFELNTDQEKITVASNTNQLLKNFDIDSRYIASCGIDQDRVNEREGSQNVLKDFSRFIPGTNIHENHNGLISITDRENDSTVEVRLGKLLNNDIAILPSSKENLELMAVNNDGFLYKLSLNNHKPQAESINLINKSLNTIDVSPNGKIAGISTDESYTILLDTANLKKQLKIIKPDGDNDITLDDVKYNLTKVDNITESSSGRYGFGTKFSPANPNQFTTIFQNGLIQIYDLRNMKQPMKQWAGSGNSIGSQIRGLCYDSTGRVYVSQESGIVHCIDPKTSSYEHCLINVPCAMPLRDDGKAGNLYSKEIMPFVSTTDNVTNMYRWFEERVGVIASNRYFSSLCKRVTVGMNKKFGYSFYEGVRPNEIPQFNRLVVLDRQQNLSNHKKHLLSEHEEAHLESMTWGLRRNKHIEHMKQAKRHLLETVDTVEELYPEMHSTFDSDEKSCYADLVPFNKLVTRDVQGLKLSKAQDIYLDVIERDQKLSHFYNNSKNRINIHHPKVHLNNSQKVTVSAATTLGSDYLQTTNPHINLLETEYHDDIRLPSYQIDDFSKTQLDIQYNEFIIGEYKRADSLLNMDFMPRLTTENSITGISVRKNANKEELVIGVGTGIYTIPI